MWDGPEMIWYVRRSWDDPHRGTGSISALSICNETIPDAGRFIHLRLSHFWVRLNFWHSLLTGTIYLGDGQWMIH